MEFLHELPEHLAIQRLRQAIRCVIGAVDQRQFDDVANDNPSGVIVGKVSRFDRWIVSNTSDDNGWR
jgi:hypothetical protein